MRVYKVTVDFETVSPLFARKEFIFASKEEAAKFVDMVHRETDWAYTEPKSSYTDEIFDADTAFMWVKDEIKACEQDA